MTGSHLSCMLNSFPCHRGALDSGCCTIPVLAGCRVGDCSVREHPGNYMKARPANRCAPSLCSSSSKPSRKLGCWDSCSRMLSTLTALTTRLVSLHQRLPSQLKGARCKGEDKPVMMLPHATTVLSPTHTAVPPAQPSIQISACDLVQQHLLTWCQQAHSMLPATRVHISQVVAGRTAAFRES